MKYKVCHMILFPVFIFVEFHRFRNRVFAIDKGTSDFIARILTRKRREDHFDFSDLIDGLPIVQRLEILTLELVDGLIDACLRCRFVAKAK